MPGDRDCSTTTANCSREEWLGRVTEPWNDYISLFALTRKQQEQTSYLHFLLVLQLCGKGQRGRDLNLLSSITFQFPNCSKICLPSCQTEAGGCTFVWEEGFSGVGIAMCSHQAAQNSSGSSLQLFSSPAFVRVITGGSKSFLLICLQTQSLLHKER